MTNVFDFIIVGGEYISGLSSSLCYFLDIHLLTVFEF
jgi:hypothetical protein